MSDNIAQMGRFAKASMNEFALIQRYFWEKSRYNSNVCAGIGDDAALVIPPSNQQLAISVDTLIAGVHFPVDTAPQDIGFKALAVNLSDLAAMGAQPLWFTLALTLPNVDESWLERFSEGLFEISNSYNIQLIGGDTTKGHLSITIQVIGAVPQNQALMRSGAQLGDEIFVTGTLGDAGLALAVLKNKISHKNHDIIRLNRPTPRVAEGLKLRGIANSAIDISDGLLADLGHILEMSGNVGATLFLDQLPLSKELQNLKTEQAWRFALSSGDDYELCFTVSPDKSHLIDFPCTKIGFIEKETGIRCLDTQGHLFIPSKMGYQHF
jgi:thiamine-monophosphate kinase